MLFAFDLDGTFLNSNHTVDNWNIEMIKYLKKKGHTVTIATGRSQNESSFLFEKVPFDYAITYNGMWIYDIKNHNYLRKVMGNSQQAKIIVKNIGSIMRNLYVQADFGTLDIEYDFTPKLIDDERNWGNPKKYSELSEELIDKYCDSIVTFAGGRYDDSQDVREFFKKHEIDDFEPLPLMTKSQSNWMDVRVRGNNKAKAIEELAKFLGYDNDEVVMFGDSLNDIEAIKNFYGVALANGNEQIIEAANVVVESNDKPSMYEWVKKNF